MPSQTLELTHNSPRYKAILEAVSDRVRASKAKYSRQHEKWRKAEEDSVAFLHEQDVDRIRERNRDGGVPEYTTLKIPYSYGVLMASHTYWTSVFLSRNPIMQFTGRHGESEQQTQALEALMDYQVQVGEMLVPWYIWLLDVGKYGMGVLHNDWVDEYSMVSSIEDTPVLIGGILPTGKTTKRKLSARVPGYSGNRLTNIRPYDFYPDPRVPARFFQKGEFCAHRMDLGWNTILKRLDQGYYMEDAVKRLRKYGGYEDRERVGESAVTELPSSESFYLTSDSNTRNQGKKRSSFIGAVECTIELVPQEWNLGRGNYPEKWVFTVTSDLDLLLGAQPLGANHDKFPYDVLEYEPEGYNIASRGVPEVLKPINDVMDWLVNSHLWNVRKVLNDQLVVDPSRIILSDLEDPMPGGAIRLAPGAYGSDVRQAVHQLPVVDVTRNNLGDLNAMLGIGQRAIGINDQLMGQINPTGRRSATEVRTGAGFGINRLKTNAEYFSAMGWTPMAQKLVQNSQQYFDAEKKFKIVGQLAQEAGGQFIDVNPEAIMGFYDFVPVDGTQPIDRIAQSQLWVNLFGQMRNFPQILAQYDMGRIFEWVAQLAGLKNVGQFKVQLLPEEQLALQQQAGNVVPIGGGGPAPSGTAGGGGSTPINVGGGGPQQ